jgi:hypothetical protein
VLLKAIKFAGLALVNGLTIAGDNVGQNIVAGAEVYEINTILGDASKVT